jgi:protein-tyrosine phosphatase
MAGFRVLVVCTGNVHRSAFAAAMLRQWADWYLPRLVAPHVEVASAGTRAAVRAPMDPAVLDMVASLGGDGRAHNAVQLSDDDIASADLVLVATRNHRDAVLSRVPSALHRTFTIREAGRIAELLEPACRPRIDELQTVVAALAARRVEVAGGSSDDDIADPEGAGEDAFRRMAREEIPPLAALARALFGMPDGDAGAYVEAAADPLAGGVPRD